MKFFVISDTHGKVDKVINIYQRLHDIDMILHLGDLYTDAVQIERELGVDVVAVKGNCDGAYGSEEYKILDTEYGKLLLAHGHIECVKSDLQKILYRAMELDCKAALFGHTHRPVFLEEKGVHLINPGSLTLPSMGNQGSYAIVNTAKDQLSASIVYYSDALFPSQSPKETGSAPKAKVTGGFLKNILNNSDRF